MLVFPNAITLFTWENWCWTKASAVGLQGPLGPCSSSDILAGARTSGLVLGEGPSLYIKHSLVNRQCCNGCIFKKTYDYGCRKNWLRLSKDSAKVYFSQCQIQMSSCIDYGIEKLF